MILNLSRAEAEALRALPLPGPVRLKLDAVLLGARVYDIHPQQTSLYDHLEAVA